MENSKLPWHQSHIGEQKFIRYDSAGIIKGINVATMNTALEEYKANAELIVKAVNAHQSLVDLLTDSYLALQIASNKNMTTAVNTDSLRASLRNKLSDLIGIDGQELQETIEKKAILSNTLNQTL